MSAYEPNATAVRLTMEERNLHRMLQERTDELGLVRRELHEWKTRAESAEREAGWRRCAMEQSTDCAGCGKHKHTPARVERKVQ